ncbi:hypothetical protein Avbf_06243, partial [Armadillidium vulgare]
QKSSNSKKEFFLIENIKEEPEEEHGQIQQESNEEKLSSCLKSSNSKNEIFLLENIKEEPEEEEEQSSFTGLDIEGMDSHTKKQVIRERIISLFESGRTKTEIAKTLGIQVATVRRWIVRHEKEGNLCDRPKPGAPRRTTLNEDKKIIQETNKNPFTNSRAIKRAIQLESI